jgi:hypothetical protein
VLQPIIASEGKGGGGATERTRSALLSPESSHGGAGRNCSPSKLANRALQAAECMPLLRGRIWPPRALPRGGVQRARPPSSSHPLLLRLTPDCAGAVSFQRPCGDLEPFVLDLPNRGLHLRSYDRPALLLQIEAGR